MSSPNPTRRCRSQAWVRSPSITSMASSSSRTILARTCMPSLGEEGSLEGHVIQCTWHNSKFDIRTGAVLGPPCTVPLKTYPVTLRDGAVFVEVRED